MPYALCPMLSLTLRDRLEQLRRSGALRLERPRSSDLGEHRVERVLPGELLAGPDGAECFVRDLHFPLSHRHGGLALASFHDADQRWLRRLAGCSRRSLVPGPESLVGGRPSATTRDQRPETGDFEMGRLLFLDTETTGLTGGPGTYIFLVGVGFFAEQEFVVRQYFMPDYSHEGALLAHLAELFQGFDTLVTFNGKSFDVPLLQTRFVASRRPTPLDAHDHLDVIHPARRLWKWRLESCSLGSLERHILGVERGGDVPGAEIPGLYFRYLRERDARPLEAVFRHNVDDLLGLLVLTARLGLLLRDPLAADDPADLLPLARLYESHGEPERAILCYEAAMGRDLPRQLLPLALRRLSQQYVRMRRWDDALKLWLHLVRHAPRRQVWPYVELAKYYEHRARDFGLAYEYADRALDLVRWQGDLSRGAPLPHHERHTSVRALRHRLLRLARKRAASAPVPRLLAATS